MTAESEIYTESKGVQYRTLLNRNTLRKTNTATFEKNGKNGGRVRRKS